MKPRSPNAAVASGVVAARQEVLRTGSPTRVGMNYGLTSADADAAFLGELANIGGSNFTNSVQFIGIDFYPGLWAQKTNQPYADMQKGLEQARDTVDGVAGLQGMPIDVIEIGASFTTETDQANLLHQFVQATIDNRDRLQTASLNWFDLWDGDSAPADPYAHYGLLHSDLSPKPAFQVLKWAIAANRIASH